MRNMKEPEECPESHDEMYMPDMRGEVEAAWRTDEKGEVSCINANKKGVSLGRSWDITYRVRSFLNDDDDGTQVSIRWMEA